MKSQDEGAKGLTAAWDNYNSITAHAHSKEGTIGEKRISDSHVLVIKFTDCKRMFFTTCWSVYIPSIIFP
jgi:hypothetical protein